jgi:nucleoside-diphosphate-sugar epimerase
MAETSPAEMTNQRVLVTGGSGFIAGHCILQLLEQGYLVRATVRSLGREATVRSALEDAGMVNGGALSFVPADLLSDAGWDDVAAGCDFVLHVASPVPGGNVKNEDALTGPARDGTLRVLRSARNAGVKRVVLTSAFHAVSWGHPHIDRAFTEDDWTILDGPGVDAYARSKTLAERAAWDFAAAEGGPTGLVTILPVAVMGPAIGQDVSGANHVIQMMLDGAMPGFPSLFIPIVDVRDVARAHLLAMTTPGAAGQRFLLSSGPAIALRQVGAILKEHLGDAARRVPSRSLPNVVIRIGSLFNTELRAFVPDLGYAKKVSSDQAHRVLGWKARDAGEAIVAAAESMISKGLVKK